MSTSHTTLHTPGGSPADHAICVLESRRTWGIVVRYFAGGGFRAVASSAPYELAERAPTSMAALERIRSTVDAFDEMLGRGEGGGL